MPAVILRPPPRQTERPTTPTFDVTFQGIAPGQQVEVSFWEIDSKARQQIGVVKGSLVEIPGARESNTPLLGLNPSSPASQARTQASVGFRFPRQSGGGGSLFAYDIPESRYDYDEGDYWEIQAQVRWESRGRMHDVRSPMLPLARVRRALSVLSPPSATYAWSAGNDAKFYSDASEDERGTKGAFADIQAAIREARHFIFIADWSFHPLVRLRRDAAPDIRSTLGWLLVELARNYPRMVIAVNTWDHTNLGMKDEPNDNGGETLDIIAGGRSPSNLLWIASSPDEIWLSNHQKFVVLDCPSAVGRRREIKAFLGGLDLTQGRFDWREHLIEHDPRRLRKTRHFRDQITGITDSHAENYNDWYSGEFGGDLDYPRQPWHDIHSQVTGPIAWDVVREFVGRWQYDLDSPNDLVLSRFRELFDGAQFVQQHEHRRGLWAGQVYRSIRRIHWGTQGPVRVGSRQEFRWTLNEGFESSIQRAYLQTISQANRFIYIETQYLIGSANHWANGGPNTIRNRVPEAIVNQTIDKVRIGHPFHTYIVIPMFPEGNPTDSGNLTQREFQWNTMEYMAQAIQREAELAHPPKSWKDFLSFYFLAQWEPVSPLTTSGSRPQRVSKNKRYMIYVHSKMMIVDDRYIMIGSANLNERSLSGDRDAEICLGLWPSFGHDQHCIRKIREFRGQIWKEHLGRDMPIEWQRPESSSCVQKVRGSALRNYLQFRRGELRPIRNTQERGHLVIWPLEVSRADQRLRVRNISGCLEGDDIIPDGEIEDQWRWRAQGFHAVELTLWAE